MASKIKYELEDFETYNLPSITAPNEKGTKRKRQGGTVVKTEPSDSIPAADDVAPCAEKPKRGRKPGLRQQGNNNTEVHRLFEERFKTGSNPKRIENRYFAIKDRVLLNDWEERMLLQAIEEVEKDIAGVVIRRFKELSNGKTVTKAYQAVGSETHQVRRIEKPDLILSEGSEGKKSRRWDTYSTNQTLQKRETVSRDAPFTLRQISQGRSGVPGYARDVPEKYHYDNREGEGVNVYIMDCGCDTTHSQFAHVETGKWRVLWGDEKKEGQQLKEFDEKLAHGTMVASKIFSDYGGTARKANPIIVPITSDKNYNIPDLPYFARGLSEVFRDVRERGDQKSAIIVMSFGFDVLVTQWGPQEQALLQNILIMLNDLRKMKNVLGTIGAGNDEGVSRARFPAQIGEYMWSAFNVIGGIDQGGKRIFQTDDFVYFNAPADKVWVAVTETAANSQTKKLAVDDRGGVVASGTSLAAPAVAGVLATFISKGMTARQARKLMGKIAHPRRPLSEIDPTYRYPLAVYNNEDPTDSYEAGEEDETDDGDSMEDDDDDDGEYDDEMYDEDESDEDGDDEGDPGLMDYEVEWRPCDNDAPQKRDVSNSPATATTKSGRNSKSRMTITRTRACNTETPLVTALPEIKPLPMKPYVYDEVLCKMCRDAKGENPVNGVIWILSDCPCK
ncbi:hypothetical protein H072_6174 [Dactylellina haptotyla CBS 200.50]|uniref:Peptidase S8/S53 domain-containing protein n=1 Tax=Dactylellina haptotyla (strain CBS 200.50) TaxID=1284197 RepID=S8BXL4_DACHA|nr:hypothetical protein H072_6174 [Dactylellina haptotyla CBS 200.50]